MAQIVDKIMNVEVLKMPVGKAFLLTAAFGLANSLSSTLDRVIGGGRIPAIIAPLGIAAAIENIGPINRFLGGDVSDLIAVAALTSGINNQFDVSGMIINAIDKITSFIPGLSSQVITQLPVTQATSLTTAPMSGYQMGNYPSSMGLAKTQLPNVDDVDLALLSARGYQTA